MQEAIISLESQPIESLSTIETTKTEMKELKEGMEVRGSSSLDRDRYAKVEASKKAIFKGTRDVQEMDNFLWHLEN